MKADLASFRSSVDHRPATMTLSSTGFIGDPSAFAAQPAGMLGELLRLCELACTERLDAFERSAVLQLGRLIGFDGAVWGCGSPLPSGRGVRIDTASVQDRDECLLHDYAATGETDPVARRFFRRPDAVQSIAVGSFYRGRGRERIGECLAAHDVAHVLLAGKRDVQPHCGDRKVYQWLTAYRREQGRPFSPAEAARYVALLPHWVQARGICAELGRGRKQGRTPPMPGEPPPAALPAGTSALSQREAEVLVFVSRGYSYKETAAMMGISRPTVCSHVRNLYGKLGVHTQTEAVFEARALGWLK